MSQYPPYDNVEASSPMNVPESGGSSDYGQHFRDLTSEESECSFYPNTAIRCNEMEDVGLDDIQLVKISTKELNKHLKRRGVDHMRQREVKARRRTLKNRGYAASCRVKRDNEESDIMEDIECLDDKILMESRAIQGLIEEKESIIKYIQEFGVSREEINDFLSGKFTI